LLFKKLCSPLIYEELDIIRPFEDFDSFYVAVVKPNADHFRHIRIARGVIANKDVTKILQLCRKAKSLALYGQISGKLEKSDLDNDRLDETIIELFEEACLDTLGVYEAYLVGQEGYLSSPLSLLQELAQSTKGSVALKCLDLSFYRALPEMSRLIRTSFPSLEAITCFGFLNDSHPAIWDPSGEYNWASYTNLTRLQFRDGDYVYASQMSDLVRHLPSLIHLLISTSDNGDRKADNVRLGGWYKREDALWRVRKPLETFQMEHMDEDEITVMGDIPTKTLIIANLRGDQFVRPMKSDPHLFPGLQYIRIQPAVVPQYDDGYHPFDESSLQALVEICQQRSVTLTRDAEATRLGPRHSPR
jgi:hypothetical protein